MKMLKISLINSFLISTRTKLLLGFGLALCLSACGGGKVIETKDDSVDYRSAQSLPPLKKPELIGRPLQQTSSVQAAAIEPVDLEPVEEITGSDESVDALDSSDVAEQQIETQSSDDQQTEELSAIDQSSQYPEPEIESSAPALSSRPMVNSKVVRGQAGYSMLQIEADSDTAWTYVLESLQASDITVFTRNKDAGKFSIGCGDIPSQQKVVKKGGWSIFNRQKSTGESPYCSLNMIESKTYVSVAVFDKLGQPVDSQYSEPLFNRLMNN